MGRISSRVGNNMNEIMGGINDMLDGKTPRDIMRGISEVLNATQKILEVAGTIVENNTPIIVDNMKKSESIATLKIKRTDDAKQFPLIKAKKAGDVGYDLPAVLPMTNGKREAIVIPPHSRRIVPTGISLEIPRGYWASIEARSSTSKQLILVPKGVIDEGYRGELFAVLINVGYDPVVVRHGDRFVQLIMHKRENACINVQEVDELSQSERGTTGFGSTGQSEDIIVNDECASCGFDR